MLYQRIETFIEYTGRAIAWLTLAMVLIMFAVVVLRFAFNLGWIWLQESVNYLHAYVFMLGAAYTLKRDAHVRVDIFYGAMSVKRRSLVDLLGTLLLLLPFCGFIFYVSWDEVIKSWQALESSQQTGGLDFAYLLKTSMLLMPLLLFIQGLAMIIRNIMILRGTNSCSDPEPG
jgi:TRAP-type mannitol/chloroaromatic compound transport system permease small subunit